MLWAGCDVPLEAMRRGGIPLALRHALGCAGGHTPSAFGAYADPLAAVVFWTRHASTREPSRVARAGIAAIWLLPFAAIATTYLTAGRAVDYPRPVLVRRLSAGLQSLLAGRALTAWSKE